MNDPLDSGECFSQNTPPRALGSWLEEKPLACIRMGVEILRRVRAYLGRGVGAPSCFGCGASEGPSAPIVATSSTTGQCESGAFYSRCCLSLSYIGAFIIGGFVCTRALVVARCCNGPGDKALDALHSVECSYGAIMEIKGRTSR